MNQSDQYEVATFGAGCFWCVEAIFQSLEGVQSVVSGYAGGTVDNPTYEQVCSGKTGHAEVCQITFDPAIISYEKLLTVFWQTHDPTTLNRQGPDVGTQYRFLADLRAQKLRTTLTVLGIAWGTVSVLVLLAFGVGLEAETRKRFHGLGDRIVILFGGRTTKPFAGFPDGRPIRLTEEDAALIARTVPDVEELSPEYTTQAARVRRGVKATTPATTGIAPVYADLRNIIPQAGGPFINEQHVADRGRVVFIGDGVADLLFGEVPPVGQTIYLGDTPFTVIGVMQPKLQNSSYQSRDKDRIFIPVSTHRALRPEVPQQPRRAGTAVIKSTVVTSVERRYKQTVSDPYDSGITEPANFTYATSPYYTSSPTTISSTSATEAEPLRLGMTVKDLNKCLEKNMLAPNEGTPNQKMEVALSYSPNSPTNSESGDSSDQLVVQSSIVGVDQ